MFSGQRVCLAPRFLFRRFSLLGDRAVCPKGLLHKYHVKKQVSVGRASGAQQHFENDPQAAARNAFWGVTDHRLTKLAHSLDVDFSMCKTVMSKVEALVRAILPSLSDTEIAAILSKRAKTAKDIVSGLINHDNMDFILDSSDQKDLKREHERQPTDMATARTLAHYLRTRGLLVDPSLTKSATTTAAAATSASSSSVLGSAASDTAVTVPKAKGSAKAATKPASTEKKRSTSQ